MKKIGRIKEFLYNSYEAKLLHLSCDSFGEEVTLIFDEDPTRLNCYKLQNCYKVDISHLKDYTKDKLYSEVDNLRIPFRLNDWNVEIGDDFVSINLVLHPLYLNIHCKEVTFTQVLKSESQILRENI